MSRIVAPFTHANAAYSLATTAEDYAGFVSMVCKRQGMSRDVYAEMLRVQTDAFVGEHDPVRWRLGWESRVIRGREAVFHTGDNGNYVALAVFFVDNGEGYVVLTNSGSGMPFINEFLRYLREQP